MLEKGIRLSKVDIIRQAEKLYHDRCYTTQTLFEPGSWLHKPVASVMQAFSLLPKDQPLHVLDLGAGVGRNSIPIAQKMKDSGGTVVCVDLLDSALEQLVAYSKQYDVDALICAQKADVGQYSIATNQFDFIMAVSTLEHVESEDVLTQLIDRMASGTKIGGINALIINTEVEEIELQTKEKRDAFIEVNMGTSEMTNMLSAHYDGWELRTHQVKPLEYTITRGKEDVLLKTKALTFIVRRGGGGD